MFPTVWAHEETSSLGSASDLETSVSSPTSDASSEEQEPQRRRYNTVAPCGHDDNIRRLRFKKGLSHYLCLTCGSKWKQGSLPASPCIAA
jgi:hypothetical protein